LAFCAQVKMKLVRIYASVLLPSPLKLNLSLLKYFFEQLPGRKECVNC
jgi:hypothetical protein